jgi:hypothetical protein
LSFPGSENMIYFGKIFAYRVPKRSISSKFRGTEITPDKEIDIESLQKNSTDIFAIERFGASSVTV